MTWETSWRHALGLADGFPPWLVALFALAFICLFVIVPVSAAVSYLERKLGADLQARVGPNRSGPAGVLQPLADFLKLLQKRSGTSGGRDGWWLSVYTMALFSSVAVLPLGSAALLVDTDVSVFIPFWVSLVAAFVALLMGLDQGTVPGWMGGLRVAAQAISGAFPALIAILCAGIRSGGFRWNQIAASQGAWPHQWAVVSSPFELIAFLVFVASGLVLVGVPPLDGGLSRQDLNGGLMARLHSDRLSLFRIGRFYGFFLWSVIAATLFLGGWALPSGLDELLKQNDAIRSLMALELVVLLIKVMIIMLGVSLVATVSPRLRADQVTDMSWKVLSPFSLIALAGTALWAGWRALL